MTIAMTLNRDQAREMLIALQLRLRLVGRYSLGSKGGYQTEQQKIMVELVEGLEQAIDQELAQEEQTQVETTRGPADRVVTSYNIRPVTEEPPLPPEPEHPGL